MSSRLQAVTFDAQGPALLAKFWAAVLGRKTYEDPARALLAGDDVQPGLRFVRSSAEPVRPNRMHLRLTSEGPADQQQTVTTALKLGARHLDFGQRLDEGHVVLGDPEGNEFCVIEPGNAYLDGCGFLGELACDGSREVGCSGARRWAGRWCGTRTRRPRSSHRMAGRRSRGAAHPWRPR